ncbi:MAG: CPBP family intramembrane metalloprotease [Anaerolineales bacterium]|nr:CPBP family intramembrane metalloprotease [Anaerolineales bacterium]
MHPQENTHYNSWLANHPRLGIVFTAITYILLGVLETLPGVYVPPLLYFLALAFLALYLMPMVIGLPYGRKSLPDYCFDIRLLPLRPAARNILLGLLTATLTLSSIYLASLLTGHFQVDWSTVPAPRWVKGLTRGIWEEVFFRGIILVLFMRIYPKRGAIFYTSFLFAVIHLNTLPPDLETVIDLVSIFLIGLLFTYLALKTGSLLPGIIFHYFHDIFVLFVQNTPGADETFKLALLYSFLWISLGIGALAAKYIVKRWPNHPTPDPQDQ